MTHTLENIYRANRAANTPARYALAVARHILDTLKALEVFDTGEDITTGGEVLPRYTLTDTNAGVTLTYTLHRDTDIRPEDSECYDPEDIAAWQRDGWHYYGVNVTATMGRFSVTDSLWGIEGGDYWETPARPLDTEAQVMSVALDYFPIRAMIQAVQDHAIAACLS